LEVGGRSPYECGVNLWKATDSLVSSTPSLEYRIVCFFGELPLFLCRPPGLSTRLDSAVGPQCLLAALSMLLV